METRGLRARFPVSPVRASGNDLGRIKYLRYTLHACHMRILFLALDVNCSRERGDAIHVRNVVRSLVKLGHSVHLIVAKDGRSTPPETEVVSEKPIGGDLAIARAVVQRGRDFRPHVIYERRFSPKISALVAARLRLPYVVELNGIVEDEVSVQGGRMDGGLGGRMKSTVRKRLLRRADAVVVVTEQMRRVVPSLYGVDSCRVLVVPNGVDPDLFRPQDREAARRELGFPTGRHAVFAGNLIRWQGLDALIEALPRSGEDLSVAVIGSGPDRDRLKAKATSLHVGDRFRLIGSVPQVVVPDYLAAADVCVAPFTAARNLRSGVSALKIYEYIACGRPVVTTDVPGAADIVREYSCGIVVRPDDPGALAKAMEVAASNPSLHEGALSASSIIRERYSWDATAGALVSVLESVIRR